MGYTPGVRGLLALLLLAQDPTVAEKDPQVRPSWGRLYLRRSGKPRNERVEKEVRIGRFDRLGTRPDEGAVFLVDEEILVSLFGVEAGEDAGLVLERDRAGIQFKIVKGRIVVESFRADVRVETPNGTVRTKGGYFFVQIERTRTRVVALEGKLSFTNSLGTAELVGGQESTARRGERPTAAKAASSDPLRGLVPAGVIPNVVRNPGFEQGMDHWYLEDRGGAERAWIDETQAKSGRRSLRFEVSNRLYGSAPSGEWIGFRQSVPLVPGKKYLIRAYLRLERIKGDVKPFLTVSTRSGPRWYAKGPDKKWLRAGGVFTAKEGDTRLSMEVDVGSKEYDCRIWLDDLFISPID